MSARQCTGDVPPDAISAALRIVAIDEGTPGADDEIDYLDTVQVARALLAQGCHPTRREWTFWALCRWTIGLGLVLAVEIFALLMLFTKAPTP